VIVHKAYQFKLDATPQQEQLFRQYAGSVRWVYNRMLAQRRDAYHAGQPTPSTNDQIKQLPALKQQADTAWLAAIHSQVLQDAVLCLDDAFARFFKKQNRYPQFKTKHGKRQSFTYPQGVKVKDNRVWLPKIGWVRFRKSREIEGEIQRATIRHKASGWYIALNVEIKSPDPVRIEVTADNSVGIDLGSIDLVTTSRGEKIANKRHYRKLERKLKREQRKLSRRKIGSSNRLKQTQNVARLHERIANRRHDDLHKLSRQLVDENQAIFCEDLNVLGIAKRMGKSAGDAGWGELLRQLKYKTDWAGKTFYQVGRYFPSSKTCSYCGFKHQDLARSDRAWTCPSCGTWLDRDMNAAINIHAEALKHLAVGQTERLNACGEPVRPAKRARLGESRISRL
jgi:putative transposase